MTDLFQPLFVISALTGMIGSLIITAMAFLLWRFYLSSVASYKNRILALSLQVKDMQQHLEYANHEETKARADATRAAATRDKLLTSLSHEIRTPMNGILGMAVLLEETELNTEQRDYIDTIISSGKILLNKVDEVMATEMLEQSKINSHINEVETKHTDLHNCIEEVIGKFATKAAAMNKELLYEIDAAVPMQVLTDTKRLQQVLTNLVENILPAEKQQVYICAQVLKYNNTDRPPALGFTVATETLGSSVQAEELLHVGDELPDNHPATTNDQTLGLSISKKLVAEMRGEIRSVHGDDTAFIFSIPLEAVPVQFTATEGYSMKDFEGKPVLIVNSNETAAAVLKNKLQQWKLHPVVVSNGEQALRIIPVQTFNLVITDMDLNGINGMELASDIRKVNPSLPLLLLNSINNQVSSQEAMAARIKLLQKPLKQHILFDNILSSLRNKKMGQAQEISVKDLSSAFAKKYPLRILVAEDNPVNQKWAVKILGKLGYQPDIAENGHGVLDMVGKTTYDLVLMDVQMPQMDGLEATKMIRVCLNKQPVIIAMTANVMHGDRMACMQAGMDDYISKPVQLVELLNMLEKWALVITEKKNYIQLS